MLKAHMGLFDHLLEDSPNATHILDPAPNLSSPTKKVEFAVPILPTKTPSKSVEEVESSDEEALEKGASSKKRRATAPVVIDLSDDNSQDEEDLDVMKMKKYSDTPQKPLELAPAPKRPKLSEIAPHEHVLEPASAPGTPLPSLASKVLLHSTGRYYDDSSVGQSVAKRCRFCVRAQGLTFTPMQHRVSCFVCGGQHIARDCPNVLCYNCWETGHRSVSCPNERAPRAACYRCGGPHDALDCLVRKGEQRRGADAIDVDEEEQDRTQLSRALPPFCCNCGRIGHLPRECRMMTMDDTAEAVDRDAVGWFSRISAEIRKSPKQHQKTFQPSSTQQKSTPHRHQHHHHHSNNNTPIYRWDRNNHHHHHNHSRSMPSTPDSNGRSQNNNNKFKTPNSKGRNKDEKAQSAGKKKYHPSPSNGPKKRY